jgi:hypothetical protein
MLLSEAADFRNCQRYNFATKVRGPYDDVSADRAQPPPPLQDGVPGHIAAVVVEMIPFGDHTIVLAMSRRRMRKATELRCSTAGAPTTAYATAFEPWGDCNG